MGTSSSLIQRVLVESHSHVNLSGQLCTRRLTQDEHLGRAAIFKIFTNTKKMAV